MSKNNNTGRIKRDKDLFDNISEDYYRKDLFSSSRKARSTRVIQTIKRAGNGNLTKSNVLEVGCGAGFGAEYLHGNYELYTGLDYSAKLIECAQKLKTLPSVEFLASDFFEFKTQKKFDTIFMIGVLHHMPNLVEAVEKCYDLLKPGGWLVVNEPQPANRFIQLLRRIRTYLDSSYSDEQDQLSHEQLISSFTNSKFNNVDAWPQGLLSTPFAEVVIHPQILSSPASWTACHIDNILETLFPQLLKKLSWNLIIAGQK